MTVRWDEALDENRVHYVLYAQPQPFDFSGDPTLSAATRTVLTPTVPAAYLQGVGPDSYPYEASLSSFPRGQTQYLVIRAVDESPDAHEDDQHRRALRDALRAPPSAGSERRQLLPAPLRKPTATGSAYVTTTVSPGLSDRNCRRPAGSRTSRVCGSPSGVVI